MNSSSLLFFKLVLVSYAFRSAMSSVGRMEKRDALLDRTIEENPDYQLGVRYDEYPTIVPKKRTALLVNKLMLALRDALDEEERESNLVDGYTSKKFYSSDDIRSMDLQRRGHQVSTQGQGRIYWRCYFNAVTCF